MSDLSFKACTGTHLTLAIAVFSRGFKEFVALRHWDHLPQIVLASIKTNTCWIYTTLNEETELWSAPSTDTLVYMTGVELTTLKNLHYFSVCHLHTTIKRHLPYFFKYFTLLAWELYIRNILTTPFSLGQQVAPYLSLPVDKCEGVLLLLLAGLILLFWCSINCVFIPETWCEMFLIAQVS